MVFLRSPLLTPGAV